MSPGSARHVSEITSPISKKSDVSPNGVRGLLKSNVTESCAGAIAAPNKNFKSNKGSCKCYLTQRCGKGSCLKNNFISIFFILKQIFDYL